MSLCFQVRGDEYEQHPIYHEAIESLSQALEKLDQNSLQDIAYLITHDPTIPKLAIVEDYIVITNFDWGLLTETEIAAFTQSILDTQACLSLDDIYFFSPNSFLIVASPTYLAAVKPSDVNPDLLASAAFSIQLCGGSDKDKVSKGQLEKEEAKRKEQIEDCQTNCAAVARAGEIACLRIPHPAGQMGCVVILEITLARCKSCCEVGMDNCFDKFMEAMQPHIKNFFDTREL